VIRPSVIGLVAVCRAVLAGTLDVSDRDALAAARDWASDEEPVASDYCALLLALGNDMRGEAVAWTLAAAHAACPRESLWSLEQALATLAALPGWDKARIAALAVAHGAIATSAVSEAA
jgi:hypothetical protein